MIETEVWKILPFSFEGMYSVSNLGRVRNNSTGQILKDSNNRGYRKIWLQKTPVRAYKVHRLIAMMFIDNPNTKEFDQVHHKDGDRANNVALNLEWTSNSLNQISQNRKGIKRVVKEIEVLKDGIVVNVLKGRKSIVDAGFDFRAVYAAAKGLTKSHHGFTFRYKEGTK
jgi:hypothetical protein